MFKIDIIKMLSTPVLPNVGLSVICMTFECGIRDVADLAATRFHPALTSSRPW